MRAPGRRSAKGLSRFRNERGSVLALVTLLLIAFLGLAALAIDLGLLYVARGEAQRAADAAAHAGAAYWMVTPDATDEAIKEEAVRVGLQNLVRGDQVSIELDDVEVLRDERKVRARVYRTAERENPVRTLFAGVLGFTDVGVATVAAAQIWPAEGVECLLPFVAPDRWSVGGGYDTYPEYGDVFDPDNDNYVAFDTDNPSRPYTGYSPDARGTQMRLYAGDPDEAPQPGWFFAVALDDPGADAMRDAISGCFDNFVYEYGDDIDTEPGVMAGPVRHGFNDLIDKDPSARWNQSLNEGAGCVTRDGENCISSSARIRPMALFDPRFPPPQGRSTLTIQNFIAVFVEEVNQTGGGQGGGGQVEVIVRFLDFTGLEPAAEWHDVDTMLRMLRIVE